jgi:hypothetical protein
LALSGRAKGLLVRAKQTYFARNSTGHDWTTAKVSTIKAGGRGLAMKLILMGDVNLMDVTNPAEPFRKILAELHAADVVFGNLECCLHLPASHHSDANEGFFADPVVGGEALKLACIHVVGIANNVNYGATSIAASIARLDEVGIVHTGAGPNLTAARACSGRTQRTTRRSSATQLGLLADRP